MAATKSISFKSIIDDLKAGRYLPVYYLTGNEPYYIDQISDYIAEHALREEEKDFNLTVMYGLDVTPSQVVDAARRYPMMAERQVVIVKEAQQLKGTDALEKYVAHPMPTTVLVMCMKNGKVDGRKRDYVSAIKKAGVLFESQKMDERELPAFIENYLRERQATIDYKSTQLISDAIGADLSRLTSELDKLLIALPEGAKNVTPTVVEQHIGVSKDFNPFELKSALINKDVFKANRIIDYYDKNPKAGSLYSQLPLLFSYFQSLMLAYYCPNRNSQEAVADWLGLRSPWAARDYLTGMRNYSGMKVLQIIAKMRETDARSKGLDNPNTPATELMKELIFFILH